MSRRYPSIYCLFPTLRLSITKLVINRIMNKITQILAFVLAGGVTSLVSCQKELDTYGGESGMYFDTTYKGAETMSDTLEISWGMKNSSVTSQEITLVVKLFGHTADYDRAFEIVIEEAPTYVSLYKPEDENTGDDIDSKDEGEEGDEITVVPTLNAVSGVDYISPTTKFVIPAGEATASIPVTLLRRDDLHIAKRSFKVRLIENNELKFLYSRGLAEYDAEGEIKTRPMDYQRVIRMDESFPIPAWWYVRGEPYFGDFSQTKAALICDVMNIDRERWMNDELMPGYLRFCGNYMYQYLLENPHYEDDGTLMEMGPESIL